jgi:hypothetical protein
VTESGEPPIFGKKQTTFTRKKRVAKKNYNPAIRSIAPIKIPNMDVDADNIPKIIYPTIIPIFSGM